MVPPCSDRISRVPPYSRTIKKNYTYGAITHYGQTFQNVLLVFIIATGLVRVRSPLLTESRLMSYSYGYLDVSVPRVRFLHPMYSGCRYSLIETSSRTITRMAKISSKPNQRIKMMFPLLVPRVGFPIRKFAGSKLIRSSPTTYRSVSRPSSPVHTKASTKRP